VNNSATREAYCECVIIGVTKGDNTAGLLARKYRERFSDNSAFNAPTAHRANDFAVLIDCHCSTCAARARALNVNNTSKGDALAGCAPTVDVVKEVTHD
jgi:hypothetical protein